MGEREVLSACAFDCPDGCGFSYEPSSGRLWGRRDHPYTAGFVCHKLRSFFHALGDQGRLKMPLLRDGGELREVSWDRALSVLAERLERAVQRDPRRVLWATGSGNVRLENLAFDLFSKSMGGFTGLKGSLCGGEGGSGLRESYRVRRHVPPEEVLKSKRIVLWGRNVAETNPHFVPIIARARTLGAQVGYLDVRPTRTDHLADRVWRVLPGADLALAMYLCRRLLDSKVLPEGEFQGFEDFVWAVRGLRDREVMAASGLNAQELEDLFRFVSSGGPVSIWAGWAIQRRLGGDAVMRSIDSLVFLLGSQDVVGGGMVFSADDEAPMPDGIVDAPFGRLAPRPSVGRFILDAKDPPVELVLFSRCNPVSQCQDASSLEVALQGVFSVCLDWRLSATARRSSLVIPVAPFPEQPQGVVFSYWHDLLQLCRPVLSGPCPYEGEVLDRLLEMLGKERVVQKGASELVRRVLSNPGLSEVAQGIWRFPHPAHHQGAFRFPRGEELNRLVQGSAGGCHFQRLRLVTPHRFDGVNGGGTEPWAQGADGLWAYLSPLQLEGLGVSNGAEGWLESTFGRVKVRFAPMDGLREGVCVVFSGQEGVNRLIGPQLTDCWNNRLSEAWVRVIPSS